MGSILLDHGKGKQRRGDQLVPVIALLHRDHADPAAHLQGGGPAEEVGPRRRAQEIHRAALGDAHPAMGGQAVPGDGVGKGHQHPAVDGAVLLLVALSDHHDPLGGILFHADQMNAVLHRPGSSPRILPSWGSSFT